MQTSYGDTGLKVAFALWFGANAICSLVLCVEPSRTLSGERTAEPFPAVDGAASESERPPLRRPGSPTSSAADLSREAEAQSTSSVSSSARALIYRNALLEDFVGISGSAQLVLSGPAQELLAREIVPKLRTALRASEQDRAELVQDANGGAVIVVHGNSRPLRDFLRPLLLEFKGKLNTKDSEAIEEMFYLSRAFDRWNRDYYIQNEKRNGGWYLTRFELTSDGARRNAESVSLAEAIDNPDHRYRHLIDESAWKAFVKDSR